MNKLCKCGCEQPVRVVRGVSNRFVHGHQHVTHGATRGEASGKRLPEYMIYQSAKGRCINSKTLDWKDYGGRGIKFLFTSFEQFLAEVGPRPSPKYSLDRRDNDGHYEPGNCRWITASEQQKNKHKISAFSLEELELEVTRRRASGL